MLLREGDQRTTSIDISLAALLAAVAGALNAAAFQATGFFSANMTGNVSALSDRLGLGQAGPAAFFGALVGAFVFGAFTSGMLIEMGRRRKAVGIYAYSVALEGLLLLALGVVDVTVPAFVHGPWLVLGLSFLMGLQNAATTRISNARVRTTHVSGMATDIGLAAASLLGAGGQRDQGEAWSRLRLHLCTLGAFVAGGVAGVALYLVIEGFLLIVLAGILLAIALPFIRRSPGR